MKAVDEINRKFGKDTVRLAAVARDGLWRMRQTHSKKHYTTDFGQILEVK